MTPLTDAILREGTDDWVPFRTVQALAHAGRADAGDRAPRQAAIDAVRELVAGGLVDIGTVTDAGFTPWSAPLMELAGLSPDYLAADSSAEDDGGFRFWLSNTLAGDRRAQQLS